MAWCGIALVILALAGLGAYFATVGLDKADKLGSVLGAFIGVAGLVVAVIGIVRDHDSAVQGPPESVAGPAVPQGNIQVNMVTGVGTTQYAVQDGSIYEHRPATASEDGSCHVQGTHEPRPE